ncbi:MAG: hypothetical protein AAF685_05665 [Cyanobacteria bacterium P01_C01_bin.89]
MQRLQLQDAFEDDFDGFLNLEPLTDSEKGAAADLRTIWRNYRYQQKTAENYVKTAGAPLLLWSCGYMAAGLQLSLEEDIEEISDDDGETVIRGRMDMLVSHPPRSDQAALCVLIIENKQGRFDTTVGIPQLLTYASTFLKHQPLVWGLVTNGYLYEFIRVEQGLFREFRTLSLSSVQDSETLLQVAIAIRKLTKTAE